MSDHPKIKPSNDPKAALDACTRAAKQRKPERIENRPEVLARIKEKSIKICELKVSFAAKTSKALDTRGQEILKCIDEYKKPEAQGRCLADVLWHAPKVDDAKLPSFSRVFPDFSTSWQKPNVVLTVQFPNGSEGFYGYGWFKKNGRELKLVEAANLVQGARLYFNCQQGVPDIIENFKSMGGSCEKPLDIIIENPMWGATIIQR